MSSRLRAVGWGFEGGDSQWCSFECGGTIHTMNKNRHGHVHMHEMKSTI